MKNYYQNKDAAISTIDNIICYTLKRTATHDVVENSYFKAVTLAKANNCCYWLFNIIDHCTENKDAFLTLCSNFLPMLVRHDPNEQCVIAFALDPECFQDVLEQNGNNKGIIHNSLFHIRIFSDVNEACDWLRTMKNIE